MSEHELTEMDATAQAELVRSGEASPAELVEAAIERAERINPEVNAIIHSFYEQAREQAAGESARRALPRRALPVQGPRRRASPASPCTWACGP